MSDHHHAHDHGHAHAHPPSTQPPLKRKLINLGLSFLIVLASPFIVGFLSENSLASVRDYYQDQNAITYNPDIKRGRIIQETTQDNENGGFSQTLLVRSNLEDETVEITNDFFNTLTTPELEVGEQIYYQSVTSTDGRDFEVYLDVYRLDRLFYVIIFFVAFVILLTGLKGLNAFLGLIFTSIVIFNYLLPEVLIGNSILWATFLAALLIAGFSMFISHGFNKPTSIAVLGTLGTIGITILLAVFVESQMRFTGLTSHELTHVQSLQTLSNTNLDLRGLFLASIILGTLGVLDDVTVSQSYIVQELNTAHAHAERKPSRWHVFRQAMSVGQEHIISLVNTLVLAYFATSIPFVIQYVIFGSGGFFVSLNNEVISGEIIRTIIGSASLFLAIPLTTLLAVFADKLPFFARKTPPSVEESEVVVEV